MIRKQILIALGAVPAFLAVGFVLLQAPRLFSFAALPMDDTASRLAFAARWLLVPGIALLAGVQFAGRRAFVPGAIEGTRTPDNYNLEINLRYNLNTLEQGALAAIAWINLSLVLPHAQLVLIPAMAFLFGFGRATFWIGYLLHPLGRAFGMVMTALPTLGALLWLAWRALS